MLQWYSVTSLLGNDPVCCNVIVLHHCWGMTNDLSRRAAAGRSPDISSLRVKNVFSLPVLAGPFTETRKLTVAG